jgi:hypothetical protein
VSRQGPPVSFEAVRAVDRYLRVRAKHPLAERPELWLGANGRGPLTATGIYQLAVRRGDQAGVLISLRGTPCRREAGAGLAADAGVFSGT